MTRIFQKRIEPFASYFFGHHSTKPFAGFHRELFSVLETGGDKIVRAAPRGHAKSTIIDLFYLTWEIVHKKRKFILLVSDTYSQAILFLEALKAEFEANERLRGFYGNLVTDKWAEGEIVIGQTMIKVIGAGMKVRGLKFRESRPDLIVIDDLENDELVENLARREKLERWLNGALIPSMSENGRVVMIGTILHFDSLLMKMTADDQYTEWDKKTYRAIQEDGTALWAEHMDLEKIEQLKREYTEKGLLSQFYQEYLNQPLSDEDRKFKMEKIKFYEEAELEKKQVNTYIAIDRAYSINKTADETGIVVVSVDQENNWYVRMAEGFKGTEPEVINKIFDLQSFWHPDHIGMEQKAFEFTFKPHLDDEMRRRQQYFLITELKDNGVSKIRRIEGLVPRFETGTIYLKRDQTKLIEQLTTFPRGVKDDIIDALAYILEFAQSAFQEQKKKKINVKLTKWG